MEPEKHLIAPETGVMEKPNYMWMSLQRIFVLLLIVSGALVIVYYTPMPGGVKHYNEV